MDNKDACVKRDSRVQSESRETAMAKSSQEGNEARERLKQDLISFAEERSKRLRPVQH